MAEKRKTHLVLTHIQDGFVNTAESEYLGEQDRETYPIKVSYRDGDGPLVVPFWFDDEVAAQKYIEKANSREEREFWLLQEFHYQDKNILSEAKIVAVFTFPGYPSFDEGDTERRPGVWAHVRSIFICDREAAMDYLNCFNADCKAAHEVYLRMQRG